MTDGIYPNDEDLALEREVKIIPTVNKGLKDYVRGRFCQLHGEYCTLTFPANDHTAFTVAQALIKKSSIGLDLDDIYNFEKALLKLYPVDELRRKAWAIRASYRDIAGPAQYDLYLKSNPPDPDKADETTLRIDLIQIQNELHHQLTILPARSMARNGIVLSQMRGLAWLFGILIVLAALQGVIPWIISKLPKGNSDGEYLQSIKTLSVLAVVAFCGAIGGAMSTLRRLQSTSNEGNPLLVLYALIFGRTSIILAPVSGAVFALG